MENNVINPDNICNQTLQMKLEVYKAHEYYGSILKGYNDQVDNLLHVIQLMKNRILELEALAKAESKSK